MVCDSWDSAIYQFNPALGKSILLLAAEVISHAVSRRTREIGIRVAIGAGRREILLDVIRRGMILTMIGLLFGLTASFGLTRLMSGLLFGISSSDAVTFGAVALLLLSAAMLACYLPARRACRIDPIEALRCE